ncbi:hypothetical protein EFM17_05325 [Lactobacillus delbrueckii]|nr:hypothetical protein [Lactobacillus delbrueckii]
MNTFNSILLELLTIGGVGSLNYILVDLVGAADKAQVNNNRRAISLVFTAIDMTLYTLIQQATHKQVASALLTIVVSFTMTLLLANPAQKLIYWCVNKVRLGSQKTEVAAVSPWEATYITSSDKPVFAYCYDFDHRPLGWGYLAYVSGDAPNNYSVNIVPAISENMEDQPSYTEVAENIATNEIQNTYDVQQHINFKQQFIMITLRKRS